MKINRDSRLTYGILHKISSYTCSYWHVASCKSFQLRRAHISMWRFVLVFIWHIALLKHQVSIWARVKSKYHILIMGLEKICTIDVSNYCFYTSLYNTISVDLQHFWSLWISKFAEKLLDVLHCFSQTKWFDRTTLFISMILYWRWYMQLDVTLLRHNILCSMRMESVISKHMTNFSTTNPTQDYILD